MKGRFSAIDIRASVQDIKERIIGLRLQNIYDINSKTFLLKFSQPDKKEFLIIESGIRIHLTQFSREKATTPSSFCTKLRKHLRTRRLTNVRQIGVDRIVEFEFASSTGKNTPGTFFLICEFYASGNVILTDHEYTVISLLRVVKQNKPKEIENANEKDTQKDKDRKKDKKGDSETENAFTMAVKNVYDVSQLSRVFEVAELNKIITKINSIKQEEQVKHDKSNKKSKGKEDLLKVVVNEVYLYGLPLSEHVLLEVGLDPNLSIKKINLDLEQNSKFLQKLDSAIKLADKIIIEFDTKPSKGYILLDDKVKENQNQIETVEEVTLYKEYHPYLFNQHKNLNYKEYPTFVTSLDQFYSKIESQKLVQKEKAREDAAKAKLETIKSEQMGRVDALVQAEIQNRYIAELIENNLELVDQIILVLRSLLASGMDWQELKDMIRDETRKGNPLASQIESLNLNHNQVNIILYDLENDTLETEELSDSEYESDEIDNTEKESKNDNQGIKVNIDLSLSAHANASRYYTMKKHSTIKKEKTLAVADLAFKSAEIKVQKDLKELKQNKPNVGVNKIRKPFWFEKFIWFISSEGYLVIAGRDVQQNEILVKKYLNKGDIYLHADMHGAATVIIKNPDGKTIPPSTLNQAGTMSVCHSKAWESKILSSAWWVFHNQVSKSAPTGEYLPTGSFMIRGKKNFLAPAALAYGFGLLYVLDSNSTNKRVQLRLKKQAESEDENIPGNSINDKDESEDKRQIEDLIENKNEVLEDDKEDSQGNNDDESEQVNNQDDNESLNVDSEVESLNKPNAEVEKKESEVVDKYGLVSSQYIQETKNEDEILIENNNGDLSIIDKLLLPKDKKENKEKGKKRISAKERRNMKKQGNTEDNKDEITIRGSPELKKDILESIEENEDSDNSNKLNKPTKKVVVEPVNYKRGQKAKLKKKQNKYADQDDEEKQIMMELLGSNKGPQPKGKKEKKKVEQKKLLEKMIKDREEHNKKQQQINNQNNIDSNKFNNNDNDLIDQPLVEKEDNEEIKALLEEENVVVLDEEETLDLQLYMDGLVGELLEGEVAEFIMPVSAPYSSLNKNKYKVKLQPGNMKKGQASKLAINHFLNQNDCNKVDVELIKSINVQDAINVMLAKSKVVPPNLNTAKKSKNQKVAKKKAKQNSEN